MTKKIICALFFLAIPIESFAKNDRMDVLKKWQGPYEHTSIYKLVDWDQRVVCYLLAPDLLKQDRTAYGISINSNSAGSISCVKLNDVDNSKNNKRKSP